MNNHDNREPSYQKIRHARSPIKEITEHYGPGNVHLGCWEKYVYTDSQPWPMKRDVWNILAGVIAVLVLQYLQAPH